MGEKNELWLNWCRKGPNASSRWGRTRVRSCSLEGSREEARASVYLNALLRLQFFNFEDSGENHNNCARPYPSAYESEKGLRKKAKASKSGVSFKKGWKIRRTERRRLITLKRRPGLTWLSKCFWMICGSTSVCNRGQRLLIHRLKLRT